MKEIKDSLSFEDFKLVEFYFASGAGAWRTTMEITADGSFFGSYSDSDMGSYSFRRIIKTGRAITSVKIHSFLFTVYIMKLKKTDFQATI